MLLVLSRRERDLPAAVLKAVREEVTSWMQDLEPHDFVEMHGLSEEDAELAAQLVITLADSVDAEVR